MVELGSRRIEFSGHTPFAAERKPRKPPPAPPRKADIGIERRESTPNLSATSGFVRATVFCRLLPISLRAPYEYAAKRKAAFGHRRYLNDSMSFIGRGGEIRTHDPCAQGSFRAAPENAGFFGSSDLVRSRCARGSLLPRAESLCAGISKIIYSHSAPAAESMP